MTDTEFAAWLRSLPREVPPEKVEQAVHQRDAERGPWVANQVVHHEYGESRG